MKKLKNTTGAAAILFSLASNVSAITVDVTSMNIGPNSYAASGEFSSNANVSFPFEYGSASGQFFFQPWDTIAVELFDDTSGATLHYDGVNPTTGSNFDYEFTLSEGQIAWGLLVTIGGGNDRPILNIMDCGAGNIGDVCTGIGTPMQIVSFPGTDFSYDGVVAAPLPASVWLFGTGLLGLVGLARKNHLFKQ